MASLSVVVPMYNEERLAKKAVENILRVVERANLDYELLVVESGSTDKTPQIIDGLAKKNKRVRALHQKRKEGLGSAIRCGFREAKKEVILYMDGDSPFDPKAILEGMLLLEGTDAVLGSRLGDRENFSRWFFSKGYNLLIRLVFGIAVKDVNFSFKMLSRRALDSIHLESDGFFIDAELIAELKRAGMRWKEISIPYDERGAGTSTVRIGPKLISNMLKELSAYRRRTHGLR
ncbi:MAG: glycosyltransferase family 2 protein [Nanoarchaeota archaeon]|nr:glycosyltransferase family 2 protein [Nanoarchaeota archaeon]